MSASVPDSHKDLLEGPIYAILTTISPNGYPQSTVMWCSYDGEYVYINTKRGTRKELNVKNNNKIGLMAIDPENPYRWIDVRGDVIEVTEDGAIDNINKHAKLYRGFDEYYGNVAPLEQREKETRVVLKIQPVKVFAFPPQG